MCGFTAFVKKSPITEQDIEKLQSAARGMKYRGPDEAGIWNDVHVCMSHVRLSIIGVNNGHQPIISEDGRFVLICNGEIYNYRELKEELRSLGHRFQTLSDSEVIIFAYVEYGMDFLRRIDGMFAFVLYDTLADTVISARDIAGKKPLYIAETEDGVVISSELKAIAENFLCDFAFDFEVIRQVQAQRYSITTDRTFLKGIRKVPPANAVICCRGTIVDRIAYFVRDVRPSFSGAYPDAVSKTRDLLVSAVRRRLEAEVPMGILLSAGIDSSAIACIARDAGYRITALSASYAHYKSTDESFDAERLANDIGLPFYRVTLDEDDFTGELEAISQVLDEPNSDPAIFPQWALYRAISKEGYKVLLSGIGGDEVFFGYPARNSDDVSRALRGSSKLNKIKRVIGSLLGLDDIASRELIAYLVRKVFHDRRMFKKTVLDFVLAEAAYEEGAGLMLDSLADRSLENAIDQTYSALLTSYLPNNGFFLADKLAMAHSIEVRCPFADRQLRNFIDTLSIDMKFPDRRAKGLLKDALRGIVPDYVLDRPKSGFTPPSGYIQDVVERYRPVFFSERLTTLGHVVTDMMCSSYVER